MLSPRPLLHFGSMSMPAALQDVTALQGVTVPLSIPVSVPRPVCCARLGSLHYCSVVEHTQLGPLLNVAEFPSNRATPLTQSLCVFRERVLTGRLPLCNQRPVRDCNGGSHSICGRTRVFRRGVGHLVPQALGPYATNSHLLWADIWRRFVLRYICARRSCRKLL